MKELRIYFSKLKLLGILILGLGFAGGMGWIFSIADTIELTVFRLFSFGDYSSIVIKVLTGASFVLFAVLTLGVIRMLFVDRPALLINEHGILNDKNLFVPWHAIESVSFQKRSNDDGGDAIFLAVQDPRQFMPKQPLLSRIGISRSMIEGNSIVLSPSGLKGYSAKTLAPVLQKYWQACR